MVDKENHLFLHTFLRERMILWKSGGKTQDWLKLTTLSSILSGLWLLLNAGLNVIRSQNHPWQSIMRTHKSTPSLHFSVHVNGTIWSLNLTRLPSKGFHWNVAWRESGSRLDQDGLNGGSRSSAFRLLGFLPLMTFCKNRPTSLRFPSAATAAAASAPSLKLPGLANASNTYKNSLFLATLQDFASYFPSRLFGPCF